MVLFAGSDQMLTELEGADRLTFGGQLALSGVVHHAGKTLDVPSLGGARLHVEVP